MSFIIEWIEYLMGLAQPDNLRALVNLAGPWWVSYLILFAIIFSETGLLVGFFLPGDSLLFAAGLLCSQDVFHVGGLIVLLSVAGVLGDAANYYLGRQMGEYVFERGRLRFVKHSHLMAAKAFYDRHGGKAIILARFVPLVRTFTPFVAGVARMSYARFVVYNIIGGIGWITSMTVGRLLAGADSLDSRALRDGRDRHRAGERVADGRRRGARLASPPHRCPGGPAERSGRRRVVTSRRDTSSRQRPRTSVD